MIITFKEDYVLEIIDLWNEVATKIGYKELDEEGFTEIFINNPYFNKDQTFIMKDGDRIVGFACGCMGKTLPLGDRSGYITCVILKEAYESTENYQLLIRKIEETFIKAGKSQSEILFFNPMMLPWYIKNTDYHQHNNAPGVFKNSRLYQELLQFSYIERATENAMYLDLAEFSMPDRIREKEKKAALSGYQVTLFKQEVHKGLSKMLSQLENPLWEKEILSSTKKNIPVLIAAKDKELVGFAGPIIKEKSGRGYFTGIGVVKEHEGHGLGTILFFKLCEEEKKLGAQYMSLYTGSKNPARKIYNQAGFVTVEEFAIMRKIL